MPNDQLCKQEQGLTDCMPIECVNGHVPHNREKTYRFLNYSIRIVGCYAIVDAGFVRGLIGCNERSTVIGIISSAHIPVARSDTVA